MAKTDSEQIQELMATYANAIDAKSYDGILACFTDDATAQYGDFSKPLSGHRDIDRQMRLVLDNLTATQHLFANFIVDVNGDEAHLTCGILAQHVRGGDSGSEMYLSGGKYVVDLRRIGDGWKMACVRAGPVWAQGNRDLLPKLGELRDAGSA